MLHNIVDKIQTCTHFLQESTSLTRKRVFSFHKGCVESNRFAHGSKADILCVISKLGLPIPSGASVYVVIFMIFTHNSPLMYTGFIVTTDCGVDDQLLAECKHAITELEHITGKTFGSRINPADDFVIIPSLLLCVRSGKNDKKLLNLGMNDDIVKHICASTGSACYHYHAYCMASTDNAPHLNLSGDKWFALDLYRHFLVMFGVTVLKVGLYIIWALYVNKEHVMCPLYAHKRCMLYRNRHVYMKRP